MYCGELYNLFSLPDIISQIKSRRMRWAGYVACMGEGKRGYKVLVGKPEGKRRLEKPRCGWEDVSEGDWLGGCRVDSRGSGWGLVAGSCEHGDEPSGFGATELVSYWPVAGCHEHVTATSESIKDGNS
jgi:hypothetical protein